MGEIMDKRIIRTKSNISFALLKLIEKKSANKITVSELAKEANIERKTFYLHYSCIEDVYQELGKTIANDIECEADKIIASKDNMITNIFSHFNYVINKNIYFFRAISKNDSYSFLLHSFENTLSKCMKRIAKEIYHISSPNIELYTDFYSAGIIKLYQSWLKGDTSLTQEEITRVISKACFISIDDLANRR
jgi:AcrR family transcriptional regulator